jgi:hypothetical protein
VSKLDPKGFIEKYAIFAKIHEPEKKFVNEESSVKIDVKR